LDKVTKEEAEKILKKDLCMAERAVNNNVKVSLTQSQHDDLVALLITLRKANERGYIGASEEFGRWVYAGGKKQRGLENRRAQRKPFS